MQCITEYGHTELPLPDLPVVYVTLMSLFNVLVAIVSHLVQSYPFDQYAFGLIAWCHGLATIHQTPGEITSNTLEIMGSMPYIFTLEIVLTSFFWHLNVQESCAFHF